MPTNQPKTVTKHPRRRTGNISKLTGQSFPKDLLFFDTETYIIEGDNDTLTWPLRLGVAIYVHLNDDMTIAKRIVLTFKTVDDFITILKTYCKSRRKVYVFAHNIKFDIMVMNLPIELDKHDIKSSLPVINERLFIWHMDIGNSSALFLDTANYGVISVEQLGNDLGYEKLSVDFDSVSESDLITYCRRDVEILEKFMLEYIRFIWTNNLGTFRRTLASQSLAAWRTRFMTKSLCLHNEERVLAMERSAYHGGRVECFRLGKLPEQDYYYLDVNSMYPYIMKTSSVPTKLLYDTGSVSVDKLDRYVHEHYVIADVEIETDTPAYPILYQSRLIFPVGKFITTLHQREIIYALHHNHIQGVFNTSLYKFGKVFEDYVNFFYKVKVDSKQAGNLSWYTIAKLLQNSLYGKLAQAGVHQEITYGEYERTIQRYYGKVLNDPNYESMINWFGTQVKEVKHGESTFSFPATAGAITANARMLLLSYIECANWRNVIYCDTDSLIVNYDGFCNLFGDIDSTRLGALKLEKSSYHCHIYGPKDYEFGEEIRHKGIPSKAIRTADNNWRVLQFSGIKPWLNVGTNVPANGRYINKSRKGTYSKGTLDISTGLVSPIHFPLAADVSDK